MPHAATVAPIAPTANAQRMPGSSIIMVGLPNPLLPNAQTSDSPNTATPDPTATHNRSMVFMPTPYPVASIGINPNTTLYRGR